MDPLQLKKALETAQKRRNSRWKRHAKANSSEGGGRGQESTSNAADTDIHGQFYGSASSPSLPEGKCETTTETRASGRQFVGLANQGSTCYLNSLIQALFMNQEIRRAVYDWNYNPTKYGPETQCFPRQLQRLFAYLQLSERDYVSTGILTNSFGWDGRDDVHVQHDVEEVLTVILHTLQTLDPETAIARFIRDEFTGHLEQFVKCLDCGCVSHRQEPFHTLVLPVPTASTVDEALQSYLEEERLEGDNAYECTQCEDKRPAVKGCRIYVESTGKIPDAQEARGQQSRHLPENLCVVLNRFEFNLVTLTRQKLYHNVKVPLCLVVNSATGELLDSSHNATSEQTEQYWLHSVLVHKGGAMGGHYTAYIKFAHEKWIMFNDMKIESIPVETIHTTILDDRQTTNGTSVTGKQTPYILFYKRNGQPRIDNSHDALPSPPSDLVDEVHFDNENFRKQIRDWMRKRCEMRVNINTLGENAEGMRSTMVTVRVCDPIWLLIVKACQSFHLYGLGDHGKDRNTWAVAVKQCRLRIWDEFVQKPIQRVCKPTLKEDFDIPSQHASDLYSLDNDTFDDVNTYLINDSGLSREITSFLSAKVGSLEHITQIQSLFLDYYSNELGRWASEGGGQATLKITPVFPKLCETKPCAEYMEPVNISIHKETKIDNLRFQVSSALRHLGFTEALTRLIWKGHLTVGAVENITPKHRRFLEENPVIGIALGEKCPPCLLENAGVSETTLSTSSSGISFKGPLSLNRRNWMCLSNVDSLQELLRLSDDAVIFAELLPTSSPLIRKEHSWMYSNIDSLVLHELDEMTNEVAVEVKVPLLSIEKVADVSSIRYDKDSAICHATSHCVTYLITLDRRNKLKAIYNRVVDKICSNSNERKFRLVLEKPKVDGTLNTNPTEGNFNPLDLSQTLMAICGSEGFQFHGRIELEFDRNEKRTVHLYTCINETIQFLESFESADHTFWDCVDKVFGGKVPESESSTLPFLTCCDSLHEGDDISALRCMLQLRRPMSLVSNVSNAFRDRYEVTLLVEWVQEHCVHFTLTSSSGTNLAKACNLIDNGACFLRLFQLLPLSTKDDEEEELTLKFATSMVVSPRLSVGEFRQLVYNYALPEANEFTDVDEVRLAKARKFQLRSLQELLRPGASMVLDVPNTSTIDQKPLALESGDIVVFGSSKIESLRKQIYNQDLGNTSNSSSSEVVFQIRSFSASSSQ